MRVCVCECGGKLGQSIRGLIRMQQASVRWLPGSRWRARFMESGSLFQQRQDGQTATSADASLRAAGLLLFTRQKSDLHLWKDVSVEHKVLSHVTETCHVALATSDPSGTPAHTHTHTLLHLSSH